MKPKCGRKISGYEVQLVQSYIQAVQLVQLYIQAVQLVQLYNKRRIFMSKHDNNHIKGESKNLELKETIPQKNQIIRTCVAFANGSGGKIIIGVKDKTKEIIGVSVQMRDKIFDEVASSIKDSIEPYLIPEIYERNINNKMLIIIQIYPGNRPPYYIKREKHKPHQGVYLRVASTTRQADEKYIKDLYRQQLNMCFDEESTSLPFSDLNPKLLSEVYGKRVNEKTYLMDKLAIRQMRNPKKLFATNTAVLFFTDHPEVHLPESIVICSHIKGNKGRNLIKSIQMIGPIPTLVESVLKLLESWLETGLKISASGRLKSRLLAPREALREGLINALIHRVYFINAPVKVTLYDSRLEIFSPGGLPGLISVENLGDGTTYLRNPNITKMARKYRLVETLGSGIRLIFDSCKKQRLKKPEFDVSGDFVKLIFYFEKIDKRKPPDILDEERIIQWGQKFGEIRIKNIIESIDISRNTATRKMNTLIKRKLFKRYGKGAGVYFKYIGKKKK